QVLGSTPWTGAANTLFLFKMDQQSQYMASAQNYGFTDNRSLQVAQGLLFASDALPEFNNAASWQNTSRTLLFNCINGQFFNDGSQDEQSPGYAGDLLGDILEAKLLDQIDGNSAAWTSAINTKVQNAVNSYFQFLTPDGKRPALGDTYRTSAVTLFLKADLVENLTLPVAKPRGRDVWLFGTTAVNPFISDSNNPPLGDRGLTDAMTDSGNYIMRSGSDTDARQITFSIGPKGGNHGHFDDLNFELFGYGKPLIADPGPYQYDNSTQRAWAISTPAHNTISIDGLNESDMEGENNPGFAVDQWDVENDHVQITAHHYGYNYLAGGAVVSRSIWYDYDGTMLIVDWMNSAAAHTATTSFLLPGTSNSRNLAQGWMESTNSSGGNVKIQSLLQAGQTASFRQTGIFTSSNPPPNQSDPATQFFVSQTGSFVAFATLITAYNGTTPPDTSAQLLQTPGFGMNVTIALTKNGTTQNIGFTPPVVKFGANSISTGQYADLKYDSKGNLHLAYYDTTDNDLKYTVRDTSGNWSPIQTIDNNFQTGFDPSMAIDSKDHVGIAYTDGHIGDLKYAFFDGTNWTVQTVDAKGSTGHYPSLVFSRNDGPEMTYYDKTNGALRLAVSSGGGWALSTIDTGTVGTKDVGRFSQLMLDPSRPTASKITVAYEDDGAGKIMYAVQGNLLGGVQKNGYTFFTIADVTLPGGYQS
ncbi:MAG TPA: alginate lyase family protein, partial [Tepidisphaeraceae bacterium]|nr:alginate lyase family protein [Tepidisphaeraceae bacterium]